MQNGTPPQSTRRDHLLLVSPDQAAPLARLLRRYGAAFQAKPLGSFACQVIVLGTPYDLLRALRALGLTPQALRPTCRAAPAGGATEPRRALATLNP